MKYQVGEIVEVRWESEGWKPAVVRDTGPGSLPGTIRVFDLDTNSYRFDLEDVRVPGDPDVAIREARHVVELCCDGRGCIVIDNRRRWLSLKE